MSDTAERKVGDLTVVVERDQCIGSGNCVKVAPEMFEMDDEDVAAFRKDLGELPRERVIEACTVCPVGALLVKESSGKTLVP